MVSVFTVNSGLAVALLQQLGHDPHLLLELCLRLALLVDSQPGAIQQRGLHDMGGATACSAQPAAFSSPRRGRTLVRPVGNIAPEAKRGRPVGQPRPMVSRKR